MSYKILKIRSSRVVYLFSFIVCLFYFLLVIKNTTYAGNNIVLEDKPQSGKNYDWDGHNLTLENYEGVGFDITPNATIIVKGINIIASESKDYGICCKGTCIVDGQSTGKLIINTKDADCLIVNKYLEFRNVNIDIVSNNIGGGTSIKVYVNGYQEPTDAFVFNNVTGNINTISDDEDLELGLLNAVDSFVPIVLKDTVANKQIGDYIDKDIDEKEPYDWSFVDGNRVHFFNDEEFEIAMAKQILFKGSSPIRTKLNNVLVKGEKINLLNLISDTDMRDKISKVELTSKKMKKLLKIDKFTAKGKKKGDVRVKYLDNYGNTILVKNLTILDKPKLKLPSKIGYEENKQLDAYEYFTTEDILITAADSWKSTNNSVADTTNSGIVTILGKGRTKLIAYFGNVKVSCWLTVK